MKVGLTLWQETESSPISQNSVNDVSSNIMFVYWKYTPSGHFRFGLNKFNMNKSNAIIPSSIFNRTNCNLIKVEGIMSPVIFLLHIELQTLWKWNWNNHAIRGNESIKLMFIKFSTKKITRWHEWYPGKVLYHIFPLTMWYLYNMSWFFIQN